MSFLKWSQLEMAEGTKGYDIILSAYERAYSEHCQHLLDYDQSLSKYVFETFPVNETVSSTRKTPRHTLSAIIERYTAEQMGESHWGPKTELDKRQHFALFQEILGANIGVETVLGDEARKVKTTLQRFPANRNKNPATRGRSLDEVLALSSIKTLSTKTINQYLQSYVSLFQWAKNHAYVDQNFFEGLAIKVRKKSRKEGRQSFNHNQYQIMLSEILRNEKGLIKKPYQKWGPLIAMYTGARLNEIAQLSLEDIKCEEGIYCFDFNDDTEDKKLKNAASARTVPVHSKLISLGLLDHIAEMRKSEKKRLFPEFPRDKTGGYGRNLGRWVNDVFLVKLGLKTPQYSFHSFRHTISNELQRLDVQLPMVQSILGHAKEGVTLQHYSKLGYTLKQLSDELEKFKW